MERVKRSEVEAAALRFTSACREHGLIGPEDGLTVQAGSQTYGRAWRIFRVTEGSTGWFSPPVFTSDGFLGLTAREAVASLRIASAALEAVR